MNLTISDMYCCECHFHTTVPRKRGQQREKGHIKTMFCPKCKTMKKFKEVREMDFL